MKSLYLTTAVCIALSASVSIAAEATIRIDGGGGSLAGILNLPDNVEKPPVVLMLHGFTGQKNEFPIASTERGLFAYAAERFAEKGIASLRIDFHGSGESDGAWEDTTFSGQIKDAVSAFDYLQTLSSVDITKVGILGYSQGGLVGGHLAALRAEAFAVVLWAPVTNPASTYTTIMGADAVEKALAGPADGVNTAKLSWGGETKLKGAFFQQLHRFNPIGAIGRYEGPLRVIVGKRETIVTPQPAAGQILLDYHDGPEDLVVVDSNHDWNAGTTITTVDDVLIPKSVEWFKAEH